jgi:predicted esterase
MRTSLLFVASFVTILTSCSEVIVEESSNEINPKHIFYFHGKIVEMQGKNAKSETYGSYEFDSIVAALEMENSIVHAEIRTEDVVARAYARSISKQLDSLIRSGVKPTDITLVGASKGANIAANISDINQHPMNYVLLAGNNDWQEENNDWHFHGQVLCFYDSSDTIAGKNYDYWKRRKNYTTKFKQIEVHKNLGHGFVYKPYSVWVEPTKKWISSQNAD